MAVASGPGALAAVVRAETWHADLMDLENDPRLRGVRDRAWADPNVVGLVLTGSQARDGMANEHSDLDAYVILADPDPRWQTTRSAAVDLPVTTLAELRELPIDDNSDDWWQRYSFAHAKVLLDRSDGEVTRLVQAWGSLTPSEAHHVIAARLDGYVNWVYRSLKSFRDGRVFEARLDAVESLSWGLMVVFAMHGRVRPYNKYLRWELENHPLVGDPWRTDELVDLLLAILTDGSPKAQRALFAKVEAASRTAGYGPVLDAWGDELTLLR